MVIVKDNAKEALQLKRINIQHRDGRYYSFNGKEIPQMGSWIECWSSKEDRTEKAEPQMVISGRVYDIFQEYHTHRHFFYGDEGSSTYITVFIEDGERPKPLVRLNSYENHLSPNGYEWTDDA